MDGTKTKVYCDDVKIIFIPQYESLSIDDIIGYGVRHQEVIDALPIPKECQKLPRDYIGNIIYTLVGAPFADWVKQRTNQRHQKKQLERATTVRVDSRVAAAMRASKQISGKCTVYKYLLLHICSYCIIVFLAGRGIGAHLLKVGSKRKRTKAEMAVARREDLDRAQNIATRLQELADLRAELDAANQQLRDTTGANDMVQHLIDSGIVEMDAARNIQVNPNIIIPARPSES